MPTYDYQCNACGHRFEEFQSMTAKQLQTCPACKKKKLERLIGGGAGVIFKGSGFYQTDYRGGSYGADAKKDSDSGGDSSTTSTSDKSPADSGQKSDPKSGQNSGPKSSPKSEPKSPPSGETAPKSGD